MNSTPFTSNEFRPLKETGIVWCSVLALETVLIITGNLLTIVAFAVNRRLRRKKIFIIINMAFADLLGGIVLPLDVYLYTGPDFLLWPKNSSTVLTIVQNVLFYGFFLASLLSAALISGERFHAVYWPLRHQILTSRAYYIATLTIWTLAFLASTVFTVLLYVASTKLAFNILMSCFIVALLIVCAFNVSIWRKFKHRDISSQQRNNAKQLKRLTKTMLFISIVALLSWSPLITFTYFMDYHYVMEDLPIADYNMYYMFYTLSLANSFLNPAVYVLRIPEFRQVFGLLCRKREEAITTTHGGRRLHKVASASLAKPRESGNNLNSCQPAYEMEVTDNTF